MLFVTAEKHLDGVSSARLLTQLLLGKLQLDFDQVVAFMRDSASANGVALRALQNTFGCADDILCLPHTLNHLCANFNLPTLKDFMTPFITLVCSPGAAKVLWKGLIGEAPKGYSAVRWYCTFEIAVQIGKHFEQLTPFLQRLTAEGIGDGLPLR